MLEASMTTTSKVQFQPKWKEELVCTVDGGRFVVEMTIPTQPMWEASAPDWARHQWERVREDLAAWCEQQKMPLIIEDHAWVSFD
jgi:hypothetical protein